MAKEIANYEAVYILTPDYTEEQTAEAVAKFKALVEANAALLEMDEWGKRRLSYPIRDRNDGYYVLLSFRSAPEFPAELDRIFQITEGVIRSMIIRKDA